MNTIVPLQWGTIDKYDVRRSTIADLANLCIAWYPDYCRGTIQPHSPKTQLLELQGHIGLTPSLCVELYTDAVRYYGLIYFWDHYVELPTEISVCIDYRRMRRPGMTMRDFHQLLWQHANLLQFDLRQDLFIPYPKP